MTIQDRIIKISNTSNFNNQTSIEYIELNIHPTLMKMINNGTLINRLEETSQNKFNRSEHPHSKLGLHSMRKNYIRWLRKLLYNRYKK